ncbi:MAG: FapA family protein [Thermodesulfobacteriota bacterium]
MGEEKELITGCPSCGSRYRVPSEFRERSLSCKKCGTSFKVGEPPKEGLQGEKTDSIAASDPNLLLGNLLIKYKYASEAQVREALAVQAKERKEGRGSPLGEILLRKGVINQNQLSCLISIQELVEARETDLRFGTLAMQNGFVTQAQIDRALEEQKKVFKAARSVRRIGDLLVEMGAMTQEQRDAILKSQSRMESAGSEQERVEAFQVIISEDRLSAFLKPRGKETVGIGLAQLKGLLRVHEITYGVIQDAALEAYLREGFKDKKPFMVAQGKPPVPGGMVEIRYHFDTDPLKVGTIKEGGYIDFRERGVLPQVKKDDLLAERVFPTDGVPGVDVTGRPIPAPFTEDARLKGGRGTRLSEDGMKLYANVAGMPEVRADGKVYVFSDLDIRGDVDLKTGHVEFQGNITVSGTVQSGFRVKGGSLTANEILKAEVEVTGDLVVFGGIIGATVRCGGNVRARYIHEAHVEALGDVVIEKEILDSRIETSGACLSRNGHIRSCHIQAKKGIEAGDVGSEASKPCVLVVGTNDRVKNEIERLKRDMALKKDEAKTQEARLKELETEAQKLQQEMGIVAQDQDRAMVKERTLRDRSGALKPGDASPQVQEIEKALAALQQEIGEREHVLEGILNREEKITQEIAQSQQALKERMQEVSLLEEEISTLTEWSQADAGHASLKVYGSLHQYTTIKGLYSTLILPESQSHVAIKEAKVRGSDDKLEWKMRMSRL